MELHYFPIPGRGEVIRLMLRIGHYRFTDNLVNMEAWKGQKEQTRWQVMPTLSGLPGSRVGGQSRALLRYLGKAITVEGSPLTPEDPVEALLVDEAMDFLGEDIWSVLLRYCVGEKDADVKAAELLAPSGKVSTMLDELERNIEGSDSLLASSKLSTFDVYLFAALGWFASGFMTKNVNVDVLVRGRPKLANIVTRVGRLPEVRAFYADPDNKIFMNQVYKKLPFCKL